MAMKENSKKVLNYLKENNGASVTAADVAEALGLEKRSVDGIFTSAIQRRVLVFVPPQKSSLKMELTRQLSSCLSLLQA